jgi:hypothetical protein
MRAGLRTTAKVVEKPPDPNVRAPEIYLTSLSPPRQALNYL